MCRRARYRAARSYSPLPLAPAQVSSLQGGFTLRRPERTFDIENKAAAFTRAGGDPEIVSSFETVVQDWCGYTP